MTIVTATELKNRLGEFMERAQQEPVAVRKGGRDYAVLISRREYERLQALEDQHWSEKARRAEQGGFVGTAEATAFLRQRLDEIEAAEGK